MASSNPKLRIHDFEHNTENTNDLHLQIAKLNDKMTDYENIVYSLEHTLSLHEKDKKQFFDEKLEFESKCFELKLENDSKQRTIERQNDEINTLMNELRQKQNTIEELKNTNLSLQNMKDEYKQNANDDINWMKLIDEKPIKTRTRAQTQTNTVSKPNSNRDNRNSNILSEISTAFFRLKPGDKTKQKSKDDKIHELNTKYMKLQEFNEMLKSSLKLQHDEDVFLKRRNMDILNKLSEKQKEINHLRECVEENQIGFMRYKEESEQKLFKWKTEKKHWFDEYKKICKQNQELINKNRKLEKYKIKYKQNKALSPKAVVKREKEKDTDIGCDIIKMQKVTMGSLKEYDETQNIPQLLRTFKSMKRNYYDDLIDKIMDIECDDDEEMDEYNNLKSLIHVLYDTLIECYKYDLMINQIENNKEEIFEKMKNKFEDKFEIWFGDNTKTKCTQNVFKKYIVKCLQISISIKQFGLSLFPSEFIQNEGDFKFEIDDILDYHDIMERDHVFDATPKEHLWFCSFPSILQSDNNLSFEQILQIINTKETDKYNIFKSKLWMFQT